MNFSTIMARKLSGFTVGQWVSVNSDNGRMLGRVSKIGTKWVHVMFPYAQSEPFAGDYLPDMIDVTIQCVINVTTCHGYDLADCNRNYLIQMGHPLDQYLDGIAEGMARKMMLQNGVDRFGKKTETPQGG